VAVFASGGGSNLQALLDSPDLTDTGHVALVVSDRADAGALERARSRGIPARFIDARNRDSGDIAAETIDCLSQHGIRYIVLAGYLRLVPAAVIERYEGRILNIHPALLPAFGGRGMYGMNVHRAVLAAGCRVTGVTVHRVTADYDEGAIIAQWPVPVFPGDSPADLAARVLAVEHVLYPAVLQRLLSADRDSAPEPALPADTDLAFRLTTRSAAGSLAGGILQLAGLRT
jgi:phosphoribosylglycinamide formyltransferase 1